MIYREKVGDLRIETDPLELVPLTARQLGLWLEDLGALEGELNCSYAAEPVEGFFREIVRGQMVEAENDPDNYLYHTFWLIIRKDDRVVVGSCGFKDVPNENGEVEIGYGLGAEFEGVGYMTEAVGALCEWGLRQENVDCVIAETEKGNLKSENVLRRAGFVLFGQNDNNWWRLRF
jgi:RimJ/RimL family protein N-acetyltransferase